MGKKKQRKQIFSSQRRAQETLRRASLERTPHLKPGEEHLLVEDKITQIIVSEEQIPEPSDEVRAPSVDQLNELHNLTGELKIFAERIAEGRQTTPGLDEAVFLHNPPEQIWEALRIGIRNWHNFPPNAERR